METDQSFQDRTVVGQALRRLRERAGLRERELAERLGREVAYISELETGRLDTRWHTVLQFLRALDASLGDLTAEIEDGPGEGDLGDETPVTGS